MRQYALIDLHMPGSLGYITFNDYVYIYIYTNLSYVISIL